MFVPTGKLDGALLVIVATPQLSLTVGGVNVTFVAAQRPLLAVTVSSAGQVIAGGCVSLTITVGLQVAVLPALSRTVQVTMFVPTGKLDGALLVIVATPQLSLTVGGGNVTLVAWQRPLLAVTVSSAGQVIVGGCVSVTMTV